MRGAAGGRAPRRRRALLGRPHRPSVGAGGPANRGRRRAASGSVEGTEWWVALDGQRSSAYRVFTRKRVFLVKSSVKILRTGLDGAGNGNFAHNNLRSGSARRPVCQLYVIQTISGR